jgi:hypothetical protein
MASSRAIESIIPPSSSIRYVPIKDSGGDCVAAVLHPRWIFQQRDGRTVHFEILIGDGTAKDVFAIFLEGFFHVGGRPERTSCGKASRRRRGKTRKLPHGGLGEHHPFDSVACLLG